VGKCFINGGRRREGRGVDEFVGSKGKDGGFCW